MSIPSKKADENICKPLQGKEDFNLSFSGALASGCPDLNLTHIDRRKDIVAMSHCIELGSSFRELMDKSSVIDYTCFTESDMHQAFLVKKVKKLKKVVALIELYKKPADEIPFYTDGDYQVKVFIPESNIGNTDLVVCSLMLFIQYCGSFQNVRGLWMKIDEEYDREVMERTGFILDENENNGINYCYISLS